MMKSLATLVVCTTLAACAGKESPRVATLQKSDKQLNCPQVQLEINEAEFYRKQAIDNKSPGFGSLVSPVGYISTYMGANKAQQAANDRIDYLNRIYEINRCDEQLTVAARTPYAPFQPTPVVEQAAYSNTGYAFVAYQPHSGYNAGYTW